MALLLNCQCKSQDKEKIIEKQISIKVLHGVGSYKLDGNSISNTGRALSFNASILSNISNDFYLGLEARMTGYQNPAFNMQSFSTMGEYLLNSWLRPYINIGYSIKWSQNFSDGLLGEIGFGLRRQLVGTIWVLKVGYNIQQVKNAKFVLNTNTAFIDVVEDIALKSIVFTAGITF